MTASTRSIAIQITLKPEVFMAMHMLGLEQDKLVAVMKRATAVDLYRRRLLSIGKAAELAETSLAEFMDLLVESGIPVAEVTLDDLASDEAALRGLRR